MELKRDNNIWKIFKEVRIWEIITHIQKYFYTELTFLFTPRISFKKFHDNKETSSFLNPELFLVINIIFAYLFYKTPAPFDIKIFSPMLNIPIDLLGVILKYVFGFLIFLWVLKPFLRKYKVDSFSLSVFHIICFVSAIYLPSLCIKNLIMNSFVLESLVNLITESLSGIKPVVSFLSIFRIFILPFICELFFICYWTILFYLGLKNAIHAKPKKLFKVTVISMILFLFIQFILFIMSFGKSLLPVFKAYTNMVVIEKLVTEKSPNYLKASLLAERISYTKKIHPSYCYIYKIRAITYKLSTLLVEQEKTKNILPKIYTFIKEYNYKEAEKLISDFLDTMVRKNTGSYRPIYIGLLDELKEARDYRNSPNFTKEPVPVKYIYSTDLMPIVLFPSLSSGDICVTI